MRISSFDIFDTCVVRKCGDPKNLFDVLSYRVFSKDVPTEQRIEFIARRVAADDTSTFEHLYDTFEYEHPDLLCKKDIMKRELECEYEMMVPVYSMLPEINKCRNNGDHIIFISDMYLPTEFLKQYLLEQGIFYEGDSIYVSGDCGYKKRDGLLFKWIKSQKNIEYSDWQHYGDNPISDVQIPASLGIKTHYVNQKYLPYEEIWKKCGVNLNFHIGGIMAGLGRSLLLSIKDNPHNAFAVDIAAPLLVTFAMRVMSDAVSRKITKLFFCSRDCYALYHVAKKMQQVIPSVEVNYFYTSREALYNTPKEKLLPYLIHIGLAQSENQIGIVDMRSTGKSLCYINKLLYENGFNQAFGYYFEMFCSDFYIKDVPPYYCEINKLYCSLLRHHHPILEKFLSLSPDGQTIGYDGFEPVMEKPNEGEDFYVKNLDELSTVNLDIMQKYADMFIETELYRHFSEIFSFYVIPTLKLFFDKPNKIYLHSLRNLYILQQDGKYIPYIEKKPNRLALLVSRIYCSSKIRGIRCAMKIIMFVFNTKPKTDKEWWPQGTKIYNE